MSQDLSEKKRKQVAYEQAAQWYMLMQEQDLTTQQQTEFDQWLNQNEIHKDVWKNVTIFDEKFHRVSKQTITRTIQQFDKKPSISTGKLSVIFMSFFAALYAYQSIRQEDYLPDLLTFSPIEVYKTQIGEQQHVVLQDGSKVWLNSASKLRVKYTEQQRHLELDKGEIYIETHKDQGQRQFTVETGHGELLALGTIFNVRYYPEHTLLSVQEGIVRVSPQNSTVQQDISAQHAIIFDRSSISTHTYETMQVLWRQQLFVVHSMPLKQFITELARYDARPIHIDASIENTLISGSYSTKNIEKTLQMVANTHQFELMIEDNDTLRIQK